MLHVNSPKHKDRSQFPELISQQGINIFQFCKKILVFHIFHGKNVQIMMVNTLPAEFCLLFSNSGYNVTIENFTREFPETQR